MPALRGVLVVVCATACATASPVLAPARVLEPGRIALELGMAYPAPLGSSVPSGARDAHARLVAGTGGSAERDALLRADLAWGLAPPGVVSLVSGRAGLGARLEGAVALIGSSVRVGLRRAWVDAAPWTLSAGLEGRLGFQPGGRTGTVPGLEVREALSYGADARLLVGWASRGLYDVWFGLRAGALQTDARLAQATVSATPFDASALRLEAAAVLGLRAGFRHLAAAIELEAGYVWITGMAAGSAQTAGFVAVVPAAALSYAF